MTGNDEWKDGQAPGVSMSDREREPMTPGAGPQSIRLFGRAFVLPANRATRVGLGIALIVGGILGFLPILGFWMVPLGLIILSVDFAAVRRARRRTTVRWGRWRANGRTKGSAPDLGSDVAGPAREPGRRAD
ncbi:hypothetical protein [Aurantimonas sp. HBX-1]|uniref:hypothetical protein n=1 Tax=Aurantimonas sp. HBX-1 TaxID=2906072 RepID=UPI00351D4B8A